MVSVQLFIPQFYKLPERLDEEPDYREILQGLNLISSSVVKRRFGLTREFCGDLREFDPRNRRIENLVLELYHREAKDWRNSDYVLEERENESLNLHLRWKSYGFRYYFLDLRKVGANKVLRSLELLRTSSVDSITLGKLKRAYKTGSGLVVMEFITLDNYLENFA